MSANVRLTLLAHGMTAAMSAGRFPTDEPLSDLGLRQIDALGELRPFDRVLAGPETRTRQTAQHLGRLPLIEPALADLDYGRWRGLTLDAIDPDDLRHWMTDPFSAGHGGESVAALLTRTDDWLRYSSRTPGRTLAITHPAVVRAAIVSVLDAPPESFWRIDITPASRTVLNFCARGWVLRTR